MKEDFCFMKMEFTKNHIFIYQQLPIKNKNTFSKYVKLIFLLSVRFRTFEIKI